MSYKEYIFDHQIYIFPGMFDLHPQFLKTLPSLKGETDVLSC